MTDQHSWLATRDNAVVQFANELPQADTEQAILQHFHDHPDIVIALINEVAEQKRHGKARSGWAILKARLNAYAATKDVRVTSTRDRNAAATLGETWIRNAGHYCPTKTELVDHLFGHLGKLRAYPDLEPRMVSLWQQLHQPDEDTTETATTIATDAHAQRHPAPA
jgi:hypothetical protein